MRKKQLRTVAAVRTGQTLWIIQESLWNSSPADPRHTNSAGRTQVTPRAAPASMAKLRCWVFPVFPQHSSHTVAILKLLLACSFCFFLPLFKGQKKPNKVPHWATPGLKVKIYLVHTPAKAKSSTTAGLILLWLWSLVLPSPLLSSPSRRTCCFQMAIS